MLGNKISKKKAVIIGDFSKKDKNVCVLGFGNLVEFAIPSAHHGFSETVENLFDNR